MDWRKEAIAVTGTPGSGKSTVSALLEKHGFFLIDADAISRDVLAEDSALSKKVLETFGDGIRDSSGINKISRAALAKLIFNDPVLKSKLEGLVHPEVARIASLKAEEAAKAKKPVVYDCPLLFETGLGECFKATLVVSTKREEAMKRFIKRTGGDESDFISRESSQLPLADKLGEADYIIGNDGDLDTLEEAVVEFTRRFS